MSKRRCYLILQGFHPQQKPAIWILYIYFSPSFKPEVHQPCQPLVGMCLVSCNCFYPWSHSVYTPKTINMYVANRMKWNCINQLIKQMLQLCGLSWHSPSILWMGLVLVTMHIVSVCQRRQWWCSICCLSHKRKLFNACTSAGICSAFVANVSNCICSEGLKRWLHSSFIVTA